MGMIPVERGKYGTGHTPAADTVATVHDTGQYLSRHLAEQRLLVYLLITLVIVVVTATILIVRHRRKIASALDQAAVDTLAKGLNVGRKLTGRAAEYRQRIVDRADER